MAETDMQSPEENKPELGRDALRRSEGRSAAGAASAQMQGPDPEEVWAGAADSLT